MCKQWLGEEERTRVGALEWMDEIEEWELLMRHYCVAWGWRSSGEKAFEGWNDVRRQEEEEDG